MIEEQSTGQIRTAKRGPRGGTTTRSQSGMVRKNLWLSGEMAELLRRKSFEERRSESDILREGLKMALGLRHPKPHCPRRAAEDGAR